MKNGPKPKPLIDRLNTKISPEPNSGCWLWVGADNGIGYGIVGVPGRRSPMLAHRALYEHVNGPIEPGLELDHLCRNPTCVNPDHLEAVTKKENLRRGNGVIARKKRAAKVTHCPRGHPYSGENLHIYVARDGSTNKRCKICTTRKMRNLISEQRKTQPPAGNN
jgi:hypothetical protein